MTDEYPKGKNFRKYIIWSMFEPYKPYFYLGGILDEYYIKLRQWKSRKPPLYANAKEYMDDRRRSFAICDR